MDKPTRFRRSFIRGHCLACGKPVFRVARTEVKWCSDACRKAAYRARPGNLQGDLPAVRSAACNSLKSLAGKVSFSRSSIPIDLLGGWFRGELDPELRRTIMATEMAFDARDWRKVVSPDGVRCLVADAMHTALERETVV